MEREEREREVREGGERVVREGGERGEEGRREVKKGGEREVREAEREAKREREGRERKIFLLPFFPSHLLIGKSLRRLHRLCGG